MTHTTPIRMHKDVHAAFRHSFDACRNWFPESAKVQCEYTLGHDEEGDDVAIVRMWLVAS